MKCKICGKEAHNYFNIDCEQVPICDSCACAITVQQVRWMVDYVTIIKPKKEKLK